MDEDTPLSGSLFKIQEHTNDGGATLLGVTTDGLTIQDTAGNNGLVFDSSDHELKIFDSTAANFASITAGTNTATFKSNTGTTIVGGGSGNITLSTTGLSDVIVASHTASGDFDSNDFTITRDITGTTNGLTGSVLKLEDLSTFTSGSSAPNVLHINQNNTGATGNLILAQTGGSTERFKVTTGGVVTAGGGLTITSGGATITAGGLTITSGALALNSDSLTSDGALVINATSTDIQDAVTVDSLTADTGGITVSAGALAVNSDSITSDGATLTINAAGTVNIQDALDIDSTIQAGSGNVTLTNSTGNVLHDALVDCADEEILKWQSGGARWGCEADATGGGGGVMTLLGETTLGSASATLDVSLSGAAEYMSCTIAGPAPSAAGTPQMRFDSDSGAAAYGWTTGQQIAGAAFTDTQDASDSEIALSGTATPSTDFIYKIYFNNVSGNVKTLSWDGTVGKAVGTIHDVYVGSGNYYTTSGQIDTSVNFFRSAGNYATGTYAWCEGKNVADYAENYYTKDRTVQAADVLVGDPSLPAGAQKASKPYDSKLIGVVSTAPAITLDDGIGFSHGRPVPVALAGRIPVKVSTMNGPIKPGDLLTSSTIPGVAMKATKAGAVIGQAMEEFSGEGVGKVMTFVKTSYSNGTSAANLVFGDSDNLSTDQTTNLSRVVLDHVINNKMGYATDTALSEVTTDRVVAGLELITPEVLTDKISLNSINAATAESISINADVLISGTLTVDKIKAKQIEGLEIFTNRLGSLEDKLTRNRPDGDTAVLAENTDEGTTVETLSGSVSISSANISLDLSVGGMLTASGGLTVNGLAQFNGETIFDRLVTFSDKSLFKGDAEFAGRTTFNNDTGGFALIKAGQQEVEVVFDKPYERSPVISLAIKNGQFAQYAYSEIKVDPNDSTDTKIQGFKILLQQPVAYDVEFSWTALSVKDPRVSRVP
jgi:hypothetical protein